jgi:hypothetical protein
LPYWHYQPLLDVQIAPPHLFLKILRRERELISQISSVEKRKRSCSQILENREEKNIYVSESHQSRREREFLFKNLENQEEKENGFKNLTNREEK